MQHSLSSIIQPRTFFKLDPRPVNPRRRTKRTRRAGVKVRAARQAARARRLAAEQAAAPTIPPTPTSFEHQGQPPSELPTPPTFNPYLSNPGQPLPHAEPHLQELEIEEVHLDLGSANLDSCTFDLPPPGEPLRLFFLRPPAEIIPSTIELSEVFEDSDIEVLN